MKVIKISARAHDLIRAAAEQPFEETGQRQPDGTWAVPVDDDTYDRMLKRRLAWETDDDVIIRLLSTRGGTN